MAAQAQTPTSVVPIQQLIMGTDIEDGSFEAVVELEKRNVRALIKTDRQMGLYSRTPSHVVHCSWSGPELRELHRKFLSKNGDRVFVESLCHRR